MASPKKIGLIACTGVVAGNMMGAGLPYCPPTWRVSDPSPFGVGDLDYRGDVAGLCVCPSRHQNPQQGGPIAYAGEISPAFGFQTGVLYYHANWIGNLAIGITAVLISPPSSRR